MSRNFYIKCGGQPPDGDLVLQCHKIGANINEQCSETRTKLVLARCWRVKDKTDQLACQGRFQAFRTSDGWGQDVPTRL